jgi:hypothetical protein
MRNKRTIIRVLIAISILLLALALPISARWNYHAPAMIESTATDSPAR